jgi:hypothetical protein
VGRVNCTEDGEPLGENPAIGAWWATSSPPPTRSQPPRSSRNDKGRRSNSSGKCTSNRHTRDTATPVADALGGHLNRSGARGNEPLLPGQAVEMAQSWGKYGPAIQRWEALTRTAPSPTEPNTRGNPSLAAAFPEWMMGWPSGWVTEVPGISRNDKLRIIGNGVVPTQAEFAIRWLLQIAKAVA